MNTKINELSYFKLSLNEQKSRAIAPTHEKIALRSPLRKKLVLLLFGGTKSRAIALLI